MKRFFLFAMGCMVCAAAGMASYGAIILDDEGVGFVGKGDVQTLFGWNNKALQDCVNSTDHEGYDSSTDAGCLRFEFFVAAGTIETNTWLCEHTDNASAADVEWNNTVTDTLSGGGISATVARSKNQVSGFNLNGGEWTVSSTDTIDGFETETCVGAKRRYKEGSLETTVEDLGSVQTLTVTDVRSGVSFTIELEDEEEDEIEE